MIGYVPVEDDNAPLIAAMADPAIRIVSLTVTEGGYYIDPATNRFDAGHPDIVHDGSNPDRPRTAFGAIISALGRRRAEGSGPFTLQCCDNLVGNGNVLRQTVVSLARLSDPDLADWIDGTCTFPNAMVDCIVPATGPNELALVQGLGIDDAAPVTHENFRQWVIEDDFCAGRPDWDRIGATFSDDVHSYETMKLRILNGGHQLIGNPGELLSVRTIAQVDGASADRRVLPQGHLHRDRSARSSGTGHDPPGICRSDRPAVFRIPGSSTRRAGWPLTARPSAPASFSVLSAMAWRRAIGSRDLRWQRRCGAECARARARMATPSTRMIRSGRR